MIYDKRLPNELRGIKNDFSCMFNEWIDFSCNMNKLYECEKYKYSILTYLLYLKL